jgi:NADH-quinone oxidoreductase subunit B|tara:strand:+ start:1402 stop:2100 length:699 start_codon:yes stop_codon:yes gene_type:complete
MAANYDGFLTTTFDNVVNWSRKFSLFQFPFVTACCGMEYMAAACSHYDISRFGAEIPRFSPRQSDVLWVVGTITHKMTPVLKTVYEQMAEPKWVIAFGACASSGGFYQNYSVLQGIDRLIPVDIYIAGCPPRPEAVLDGLMELQDRIQNDGPTVESKMINPQAIRHQESKKEQLDHYFRIPKKEVFENVQNPKSNRSIKPGFTYNQNQANVSPNMGYDTPKGFQEKEALREE